MPRRLASGLAAVSLAALLLPARAPAADTIWNGGGSLWDAPANWDAGVPGSGVNAWLPSSATIKSIQLALASSARQLVTQAVYVLSGPAGAVLSLADQLYVIDAGRLTVNNSAAISSPNGTVGLNAGSSGNALTLSGNLVSLAIGSTLNVGYQGINHLVQVEAGSLLTTAQLVVGALADATANSLIIKDAGSQVTISGNVPSQPAARIGQAGSQNTVEVQAGATLLKNGSGDLILGDDAGSGANKLTIKGGTLSFGSPITSSLLVGNNGSANVFRVEAGGTANTGQARIGTNGGSDNNQAIVTGAGSTWSVAGTLRVGSGGSGNSLDILDGGAVTLTDPTKNLWIGYGLNSSNNTVTVSGSGSVLNVIGAGSEVVIGSNSGTGTNNRLLLLDSGLANVRSVQIAPAGILQFGNGAASGSLLSSATINGNAGGAVVFNHNQANLNIANTLSGPLRVRQEGSGRTTLSAAANTYSGNTEVAAGTLALSGASSNTIASSPQISLSSGATLDVTGLSGGLSLASGQTLGGAGTVLGNVTVSGGSTLSPGLGGIGTLLFQNDLTIAGTLAMDLDGASADRFSASLLSLQPGSTLQFTTLSGLTASSYVLADYTTLSGSFGTVSGLPAGYQLDYNYLGQNRIALSVIPTPGPLPLLGLGTALGWSRRLRRRIAR